MTKVAAEILGTFCLVFAGTSAIVVNDQFPGTVTHVGVSLTFGLVVLAMIYAVGDVSGAHLNPAVTIGFWSAGRMQSRRVPTYLISQIVGALLASIVVRFMFPDHASIGVTVPSGSVIQSFMLETLLTMILMWVILCVATDAKEKGIMAGVAIGSVIAFEALLGGPISGASMNPARSLAPALITMKLGHVWIYLFAPVLGSILAVPAFRLLAHPTETPAKLETTS